MTSRYVNRYASRHVSRHGEDQSVSDRYFSLIALLIAYGLAPLPAMAAEAPDYSVTTLWENKYVSEGRDNLDNAGLFSIEGTIDWQQTSVGVWLARGESGSYEELNISMTYDFDLGPFAAYIGYTRLEFFEDDPDGDNEIGLDIAVNGLSWLTPAIDYVYSADSDGGFLELSLRSEITSFHEQLTLEFYVLEGFDFGYASEGYDGPNHLQVGIDFIVILTDRLNLVGSLAHSWAHEDIKRQGFDDLSWASVGLSAQF